ncbi:MAG: hypothetical protein JO363_20205, partial [Solirubrobacterales bacterium]|nr:hypothetical protein [Solirubrobacterales bacterium]
YSPLDAIFSAAHYLAAHGGVKNLPRALYAYNQATFYAVDVLRRARIIHDHAYASAAAVAAAGDTGLGAAETMLFAADHLAADGGRHDTRKASFIYNHPVQYVNAVLCAQLNSRSGAAGTANPFPGGWQPNRADMGYDGTFTGSVVAPVSGTITYAASSFSNWGGYLELKADRTLGLPSQTFYFAEGLMPSVVAGQHVTAGQTMAIGTASPWNGIVGNIEWGIAGDGNVGTPTNPVAETGIRDPADMVRQFLTWAESTLGLPGPTSLDHAGYA